MTTLLLLVSLLASLRAPVLPACATSQLEPAERHCLDTPKATASESVTEERLEASSPTGHQVELASMGTVLLAQARVAPPVAAPTSADDAIGLVPTMLRDFSTGGSAGTLLGAGVLVMLLVYAFRAFVLPHTSLQPSVLPFVAVGIGVLGGIGAALASGQALLPAVLSGLVGALGASGGHELLTAAGIPVPQSAPAGAKT